MNWLLQTDYVTVFAPMIVFFLTTYGASPNVCNIMIAGIIFCMLAETSLYVIATFVHCDL